MKTACILLIGNEILSGRTRDQNAPFMATRLGELGVKVMEMRVIRDDEDTLVEAVNTARATYDYVFTTGGIGPTHDDITAPSIAKAFGVAHVLNQDALKLLVDRYGDDKLNQARLRMAHTPQGATLIENPVSAAPGFQMANVFVMAGVPEIRRAMFDGIGDRIAGGAPMCIATVRCDLPEGQIASDLGALQSRFDDVEIGSYPFYADGKAGCDLVLRSPDPHRIEEATAQVQELVRTMGDDPQRQDGAP